MQSKEKQHRTEYLSSGELIKIPESLAVQYAARKWKKKNGGKPEKNRVKKGTKREKNVIWVLEMFNESLVAKLN